MIALHHRPLPLVEQPNDGFAWIVALASIIGAVLLVVIVAALVLVFAEIVTDSRKRRKVREIFAVDQEIRYESRDVDVERDRRST